MEMTRQPTKRSSSVTVWGLLEVGAMVGGLPLRNGKVVEVGESEVPSIAATIEVGGRNVFLLGTHPLPPASAAYARLRNEQFREIAAQVRRCAMPAIVLGDLNSTPWSPYFKELLRDSGLQNASQGRGLFGSWPAWMPLMRIPLDHCLASPSIRINNMRLGPGIGSDHLPLVVDVQIPMLDTKNGQAQSPEVNSDEQRFSPNRATSSKCNS